MCVPFCEDVNRCSDVWCSLSQVFEMASSDGVGAAAVPPSDACPPPSAPSPPQHHHDEDDDETDDTGLDDDLLELGFLCPAPPAADDPDAAEWRPHLDPGDEEEWDGGKAGGRPAWLLVHPPSLLPSGDAVQCRRCGVSLTFLLQLYAPVPASVVGHDGAFHRCLYLFLCQNTACVAAGNVLALRCQAREDDAAAMPAHRSAALVAAATCGVCGVPASAKCSLCSKVAYCGKAHQRVHWKAGHKAVCKASGEADAGDVAMGVAAAARGGFVFPEFDVDVESEPPRAERAAAAAASLPAVEVADSDSAGGGDGADADADADAEMMASLKQSDLPGYEAAMMSDPVQRAFARRIAGSTTQCVRYRLWRDDAFLPVSNTSAAPLSDVPPCASCGAPRRFEFQVLPQMLSFVVPDTTAHSLDFETLAVYTCSASCNPPASATASAETPAAGDGGAPAAAAAAGAGAGAGTAAVGAAPAAGAGDDPPKTNSSLASGGTAFCGTAYTSEFVRVVAAEDLPGAFVSKQQSTTSSE